MKFAIIGGYGKQGKKLVRLLQKNCQCDVIYYLHHEYPSLNKTNNTSNIESLLACDGIIIASPNSSHFRYIKYLNDKNYFGYIYCEKPACVTFDELKYLSNLPFTLKTRLLFGFNLRFDNYLTNKFNLNNLGKCLYITIINGHGLAYKAGYENSWRNSLDDNKNGIVENVLIHYIDKFLYDFGNPLKVFYQKKKCGPVSVTYDTVHYSSVYDNDMCLDIFLSYAMPCVSGITIIYENGIVEFGDKISIRYPRDYYDENGNFIRPPVRQTIQKNLDEIWTESQNNIMCFFLEHIINKQSIDLNHFNNSIKSTKCLLEME